MGWASALLRWKLQVQVRLHHISIVVLCKKGAQRCVVVQEAGRALVGKLCAHVRPKCHPLLLDTSINSPATVRLNLFQISLLAAMKLHCQVLMEELAHNVKLLKGGGGGG